MDRIDIDTWAHISAEGWSSLVLGNGASIEAVHGVQPVHADVAADLQRVGVFASAFPTIVSLNYDLTLYWAMLLFNAANGS